MYLKKKIMFENPKPLCAFHNRVLNVYSSIHLFVPSLTSVCVCSRRSGLARVSSRERSSISCICRQTRLWMLVWIWRKSSSCPQGKKFMTGWQCMVSIYWGGHWMGETFTSVVDRPLMVQWVIGSIPHGRPIELFKPTGVTKAMVYTVLSVGRCI